ncbi:MAG: hypothetical protein A2V74_01970 [Acidobacteria bacterium RBG_16_70_10]|nr:MAG: hypothetical protein A2V74_01970 [Acidobacteria bacterium RBG_16_70_10]
MSSPTARAESPPGGGARATLAGAAAAVLWVAWCVRWFDVAAPWRPSALAALPPLVLVVAGAALLFVWLRARAPLLWGAPLERAALAGLLLVVALAVLARLPFVVQGAAAVITPDGTVYGIVTLRILAGAERLVFLPSQPYGGTLTSHLVAPLASVMDLARAFALGSVLFYAAYVAGLYRLTSWLFGARTALVAGLYAVFSPVMVTRYSLNNDGTYVELLAIGTWALWLAARWLEEKERRPPLAFAVGLLLGLCLWYHLVAVIHVAAVGLAFLLFGGRHLPRSVAALASGSALGCTPALLWNAANDWQTLEYLLPGMARDGEAGTALLGDLGEKLAAMVTGDWPVLMGYDQGYGGALDRLLLALGWLGVAVAIVSVGRAAATAVRTRSKPLLLLLLFVAINLAVVLLALRHVPGNPRYLLCLMSVLPAFIADAFGTGWRRALLLVLIAGSALASLAQLPPTMRKDARWRSFVARLETEGVRFCYTDFHLASPINFLSRERVVCSAKLGPFTTEFFTDFRRRVEAAPEAAFIAVNRTAAGRLERRLGELGVGYERLDLMKPVLLRLARKVDPAELFPGREFPLR